MSSSAASAGLRTAAIFALGAVVTFAFAAAATALRLASLARKASRPSEEEEFKKERAALQRLARHSAVTAHPQPQSLMMRHFSSQRDMLFTCMQMLTLDDVAHLNGTCRLWRSWVLNPPFSNSLGYAVSAPWYRLRPVLECRWALQLITSVAQTRMYPSVLLEDEILFSSDAQRTQMMEYLLRCYRLRELQLTLSYAPVAELIQCFTALAPRLRVLRMHTLGNDAQLLRNIFRTLHLLRGLEEVEVVVPRLPAGLDFPALPLLPRLSTFTLRYSHGSKRTFYCTPALGRCLMKCRALTSLSCGCWHPYTRAPGAAGQLQPSAEQQIAAGIGALVSGWLDAPPPVSLSKLHLRATMMTSAVWTHVSRLTSLTALHPRIWSTDITEAQWTQLARFSQLTKLHIAPQNSDWLQSSWVVPPLCRCMQLRTVTLVRMELSGIQLRSLCTSLPLLQSLTLRRAHVEDCAPLDLAPSLRSLILDCCSGADGTPMQFRSTLPAMAYLTSLKIIDAEAQRLTHEQAVPLDAALFARMPKLRPKCFEENLLSWLLGWDAFLRAAPVFASAAVEPTVADPPAL